MRQKRSSLTLLLNQFRDDGKRTILRNDKLITDDETFTFHLKQCDYQKLEPRGQYHSSRDPWTNINTPTVASYEWIVTMNVWTDGIIAATTADFRDQTTTIVRRPNARDTTSDNNDTGDVRRRDSRRRKNYSQHYTSGNGFSRRQERQHHDSNGSDGK